MTLPILPIPNTQPQYSHNVPGIGNVIGQQLQQLLKALAAGGEMRQGQERVDLYRQQLAQQAEQQQRLLAERQAAIAAQQAQAVDVGKAMQMFGQTIPTGIGGAGVPVTPEMATQMVRPENVPALMEAGSGQFQEFRTRAETARKEQDAKAAQQRFVKGLPPPLQAYGQLLVEADVAGLPAEAANTLFRDALNQVPPEAVAAILKKHPGWAGYPASTILELGVDYEKERNQAAFRPPEKEPKLLPVPPALRGAHTENIQTMQALERLFQKLGLDPENEGLDLLSTVSPGGADTLNTRRAAIGVGNIGKVKSRLAAATGKTLVSDMVDAMQRVRYLPLRKGSGANMTPFEVKEMGFLPEVGAVSWETNVSRMRAMYRFIKEQNQLMEASLGTGYMPLSSGPTPEAKRNRMKALTGTYP